MKHNGVELVEVTEPQICNPPKKMFVWNEGSIDSYVIERDVVAIVTINNKTHVFAESMTSFDTFDHCAEIPEEAKPRRATERELSRWLGMGLGEVKRTDGNLAFTNFSYDVRSVDKRLSDEYLVRRWDDDDWHEPTAKYMGLGE